MTLRRARTIARAISDIGGRAYVVGGAVRDTLLGLEPKDIDLEVYNLDPETLYFLLLRLGEPEKVGASFGVIKMDGLDIAIPRRERSSGEGHQDFEVECDPSMSIEEAAKRRDLTINAIMYDPLTEYTVDPLNGQKDLENKLIRHCSDRFTEDPLRVLRVMQFVSRFDFEVAPQTTALCRTLNPNSLSKERIFDEFDKMLCKGTQPSAGLKFLRDCDWISFFPALHLDDEAFNELCSVLDRAADARSESADPQTFMWSVLGRFLYKNAEAFIETMTAKKQLLATVATIATLEALTEVSPVTVRHLAKDLSPHTSVEMFARVLKVTGDSSIAKGIIEVAKKAKCLTVAPVALLQGRHLINRGLEPGNHFGEILSQAYTAQLDGKFETSADAEIWLDKSTFLKGN